MSDGRTRIEFVRSGGVAGMKLGVSLDSAELSPEEAAELDRMAGELEEVASAGSDPGKPGGADRYQFDISVTRGEEQLRLTLSDAQLSERIRPVIERLVDLARRARERGSSKR